MGAEEYLALGETSENYELVDGVVCMSPKPSPRHQKVLRLIQRQLEAFADAHPGVEYFPDSDVVLDARVVLAPDLACYRAGRLPRVPERLDVIPDLVIEILSPSNRAYDLTQKRAIYGRYGVGEYWVVDPEDGSVKCFRRDGPQLVECQVAGNLLEAVAIDGLVLDLRPLRELARDR
jgi:Uma2 family endonuclease